MNIKELFCKALTEFYGEPIDDPAQLRVINMTGGELMALFEFYLKMADESEPEKQVDPSPDALAEEVLQKIIGPVRSENKHEVFYEDAIAAMHEYHSRRLAQEDNEPAGYVVDNRFFAAKNWNYQLLPKAVPVYTRPQQAAQVEGVPSEEEIELQSEIKVDEKRRYRPAGRNQRTAHSQGDQRSEAPCV